MSSSPMMRFFLLLWRGGAGVLRHRRWARIILAAAALESRFPPNYSPICYAEFRCFLFRHNANLYQDTVCCRAKS